MNSSAFPVEETSIRDIQRALQEGRATCRGLAEAYLRRIEAYDRQGSHLNAVITVNPKAMEEAEALDRALAQGQVRGPLHGIPILVKDNVETAGWVTTSGSLSLEDYVPARDAFIVQRLRDAGALILAKTNLHEFAIWGESVSSVLGQAVNPYDLTRTPGGSSGGTGAGIAADFAAAGIGTDTINSIRSPASACSCVGLRPTLGLVSRGGISPYSLDQDTAGPICRTVEDAALILDTVAGYDPEDAETAWATGSPLPHYADGLDSEGLRGRRVGVLRSLFGVGSEHAEVNAVMEKALGAMREQGATLIEIEEPFDANRITSEISVHLHTLKDDLEGYLKAIGAPYATLPALIASGKIHPGIVENLRTATRFSRRDDAYRTRTIERLNLRRTVMKLMADHALDALAYPHQRRLVALIGEAQLERNGVLASASGFPAIAVPAGFSAPTETAPLGVPIGMELMGRPWSEGTLLSIAYAFERHTRFRRAPQSTPPLK